MDDPDQPDCSLKKHTFVLQTTTKTFFVTGTCIHHGQWDGEIMVKDGHEVCAILGPSGVVCRVDFSQPEC